MYIIMYIFLSVTLLYACVGGAGGACAIVRGRRPNGTWITAEATYSEPWMRRNNIFRAMDDVFLHQLIFTSIMLAILYAHSIYHPYAIIITARGILCSLCVYLPVQELKTQ